MRILWLTIDRSKRVQIVHQPIMEAMAELEDVTIRMHDRCRREEPEGDQSKTLDTAWMNEFDVVFTDAVFGYMGEEWDKIKALKCVYLLDLHAKPFVKHVCRNYGFDVAFHRTRAAWDLICGGWGQRAIWLPHSIEPKVFHPDAEQAKEYTVLSVGEIKHHWYHVRWQAHTEMKGSPGYRRIGRPWWKDPEPWPIREDYAEQLRMAQIVVSCCTKRQYPVLKTFEIPACGSALASDTIDELADLGFVDKVNYIGLNDRTPGAVKDKLMWWLQPEQAGRLARLTDAGTKLVHERHTGAARARELQGHLKTLLEERHGKGK